MKILQVIYYVFVGLIALISVLFIISTLPITGNFKILTVISGSMEPNIKLGSLVVIKPESNCKIGDVITFGANTKTLKPTTHRIYDIKIVDGSPVYITKGDANNAPDSKEIQKKDVIGKVLFSVPFAGYAVDFAKKPIGFALVIILPALLIIADEVKKIYSEIKNKKSKNE